MFFINFRLFSDAAVVESPTAHNSFLITAFITERQGVSLHQVPLHYLSVIPQNGKGGQNMITNVCLFRKEEGMHNFNFAKTEL